MDEQMLVEEFEQWWAEVEAYANEHLLPLHYVEEEFCLEGEFIPIHMTYEHDHCFDYEERDENIQGDPQGE